MATMQARKYIMAIFGEIEAMKARKCIGLGCSSAPMATGRDGLDGFSHQSAGEQGGWILPGNIPKLNRPGGFLRQQADLMMADTAMNVTKYPYCCILTEE